MENAEGIRSATIAGVLSAQCHATIVSLQDSYAQDYATDFRKLLDVINWKYDERFATSPIDKGITVRGLVDQIQSRVCAITLVNQLKANVPLRRREIMRWTATADAPDFLKQCPDGLCIEVDFGKDDGQ